jgi:hypothetical protein
MPRVSLNSAIQIYDKKYVVKYQRLSRIYPKSIKTPTNFNENSLLPKPMINSSHDISTPMETDDINIDIENSILYDQPSLDETTENQNDQRSSSENLIENMTCETFPNIFISQDKSLYEKCHLSVNEASLLIVSYSIRYLTSMESKKNLVLLIKMLLPRINYLPKSYNKILAKIVSKNQEIKEVKFCQLCQTILTPKLTCVNASCLNFQQKQNACNTFHHVNIQNQANDILNTYWTSIEKYRNGPLPVLDFLNSSFYKSEKNTLQLCVHTDGVPIFTNPSQSAWPVFVSIVE